MEKLINACIKFLNLKSSVEVRLVPKLKFKNCRAYHIHWVMGKKVTKHIIRIRIVEDDRDCDTILAHEFVHAWQAEYSADSKTHGIQFQVMTDSLRRYLNNNGFNIAEDIYCKETDI